MYGLSFALITLYLSSSIWVINSDEADTYANAELGVFLQYSSSAPRGYRDIIYFGDKEIKRIFSKPENAVIRGNVWSPRWKNVVKLIKDKTTEEKKAVQLFSELKMGDFLEKVINEHHFTWRSRPGYDRNKLISESEFLNAFDLGQKPIVLTNSVGENWGILSTEIVNRSTNWLNLTNHLYRHKSDYSEIGRHPKVLSFPLGVAHFGRVYAIALKMAKDGWKKTKLLTINNSGWKFRASINKMVADNFNGTVSNSFMLLGRGTKVTKHYREFASSKFVLCPPGLGYDSYRLWETLLLGSIPIVESNAGFDRTYSMLPVLVVKHFSQHASDFHWDHLTQTHWLSLVDVAVRNATIDHISLEHPFTNPFCNFLEFGA